MVLKLDHIVYPTWNAAACLAFYRDLLGLALTDAMSGEDWGGYPWLMLFFRAGDGREIVRVALRGSSPPQPAGLPRDSRHLAFAEKSTASLQRWRARLAAANISFWEETHGARCSLYFEDPDGVILEITAPHPSRGKIASQAALAAAEKWIAAGEKPLKANRARRGSR